MGSNSSINAKTKINLILGDPIDHSLSPGMHNAAYEYLDIAGEYVYLAARVEVSKLKEAIQGLRVANINGITCTIPHKIEVLPYLDEIDPVAKQIGAVNSIVNIDGRLKGYNTDWLGILKPLKIRKPDLKGVKVALVGAGGAARAAAYAMKNVGADLYIFNRTVDSAKSLANEFGGKAFSLDEISLVKDCEVVINSTNVGMGEYAGKSLVPAEYLHKEQIIFDFVYNPLKTKLVKDAEKVGATIIYGYEMLLYQGTAQFELYTGKQAPEEVMHNYLKQKLNIT